MSSLAIIQIQKVTAEVFGVPFYEMTSHRRSRRFARPRQAAMSLARALTPWSLPVIGKHFGDRDHTTVIHALNKVEQLVKRDPDFAARLQDAHDRLAKINLSDRREPHIITRARERYGIELCIGDLHEFKRQIDHHKSMIVKRRDGIEVHVVAYDGLLLPIVLDVKSGTLMTVLEHQHLGKRRLP